MTTVFHAAQPWPTQHAGGSGATLFLIVVTLSAGGIACAVVAPRATLLSVAGVALLGYVAAIAWKVDRVRRSVWHVEVRTSQTDVNALSEEDLPMYSVLIRIEGDASEIARLCRTVEGFEYPRAKLEILLLRDEGGRTTVSADDLPPFVRIVDLPHTWPMTSSSAWNQGLMHAKGDLVVVFDTNDDPDPLVFKRVVAAFAKCAREVAVVRAGAMRDTSAPAPAPRETRDHFATAVLREAGGWNPFDADADLNIRVTLHDAGYRSARMVV